MIKAKTFNNGVRLVTEYIPYVQSVSIGIWVKAGSANEEEYEAGVSHFIEHMIFKGTEKRSAKKIAEDADRIAGQMNAFTGREATCYYIKTLSSNMEKAMDILTDIFRNSLFDSEELNKERNVILEEMKMGEDTPDDDIHDIITYLVFNGDPIGRPIIGNKDTLNAADRDRLLTYIHKRYIPKHIVVSVSGNFDEEKVTDMVEEAFDMNTDVVTREQLGRDKGYEPWFRSKVKDIKQSHICLATMAVSRTDPMYDGLVILNNILGGSMSSRLFQNIREQQGLAYSVYSMMNPYTEQGSFVIYAGVGQGNEEKCIEGIKSELRGLVKYGVSRDEVMMAKEQTKGSFIYGLENINNRMYRNGQNLLLDNRIIEAEEVIGRIDAVDREDMDRAIGMISDIGTYSGACISGKDIDIKRLTEA